MTDQSKRRRHRQTVVCEFCRKRKVRCDKGNPCLTCKKYNRPECIYKDFAPGLEPKKRSLDTIVSTNGDPLSKADLEQEVKRIKDKIRSIENSVAGYSGSALNGVEISPISSENDHRLSHESSRITTLDKSASEPNLPLNSMRPDIISKTSTTSSYLPQYSSSNLSNFTTESTNSIPMQQTYSPTNYLTKPASASFSPESIFGTIYGKTDLDSLLGFNPISSTTDSLNFYADYTSVYDKHGRRGNSGPLSWYAFLRKDKALSFLWSNIHERKKALPKETFFNADPNANNMEKHFSKKMQDAFGITNMEPLGNKKPMDPQTSNKVVQAKESINAKCTSLGLSFYTGEINEDLEFMDKIELILPVQLIIWLLIQRFFDVVYPVCPVIDEENFREDISKIIGPQEFDNRKRIKIRLEKKLDYGTLGLLLLVIRLGYLSFLDALETENQNKIKNTDNLPEIQKIRFILKNPVIMETVEAAHYCLNQFNILKGGNLTIMQLAFMIRFYHNVAPEDGDNHDGDAQIFNGTLVQMAISLGFHREPDNFTDSCNNERENNLGRKLWHLLKAYDLFNSMDNGTPLLIHDHMFDTKNPYYKRGNSNILDERTEQDILQQVFPKMESLFVNVHRLVSEILNIKGEISMVHLADKVAELETEYYTECGSMRSLINGKLASQKGFVRVTSISLYFSVNNFIVSIYFHFFMYYMSMQNFDFAFYYLKKSLRIGVGEMVLHAEDFLNNSANIFEGTTNLTIMPSLLLALHKSFNVVASIVMRVRYALNLNHSHWESRGAFGNQGRREDIFRLTRLDQYVVKCQKLIHKIYSSLSARYFAAWRNVKMSAFTLGIMTDNQFYRDNLFRMNQLDWKLTDKMVDELVIIFSDMFNSVKVHKDSSPLEQNGKNYNNYQDILKPTDQNPVNQSVSAQNPPSNNTPLMNFGEVESDISSENPHSSELIDNMWMQMIAIKRDPNNNQTISTPGPNSMFDVSNFFELDTSMNAMFNYGGFLELGDDASMGNKFV